MAYTEIMSDGGVGPGGDTQGMTEEQWRNAWLGMRGLSNASPSVQDNETFPPMPPQPGQEMGPGTQAMSQGQIDPRMERWLKLLLSRRAQRGPMSPASPGAPQALATPE